MKNFSRFTIALIPLVVGFGACTVDVPVPGDEIAAAAETPKIEQSNSELSSQNSNLEDQNSNFEGTFQDAEHEPRACHVNLLYCNDPRPQFRGLITYCSNDCEGDRAYNAARSLCNRVCGNINCNAVYSVGGC